MNVTMIGGLLMMEIFRRWNVFLKNSKRYRAPGYWFSMRKLVCIPFQLLASLIYNGVHYYSVFCTDEHYIDWWIADDGDIQKVECISQ
jgi:hypothetical protein